MKTSQLLACVATLALAAGATTQVPVSVLPQPEAGHGIPGRLVPGAEQWLVEFQERSFDLSRLAAAREAGASAADVEAIVASYRAAVARDNAAFVASVEKLGGKVYEQYWIVNGAAIEIPFARVGAVKALPNVKVVSPNLRCYPLIKTATSGTNHNSDGVNALGYKGKQGVATAIVDTGLDSNCGSKNRPHRTFYEDGDINKRNRLLANVQVGTVTADNSHPHGTGVAGIAAGGTWGSSGGDNGHAPHADIVGYAISNNSGGGSSQAVITKAWQQVLADAVKYGIKTANNSYSGWSNPLDLTQQAQDACARTGDIMIVVAAGNSSSSTLYSQSCANGLAVAALTANSHTVASFSSRGPLNGDTARFYPDIAACGVATIMPDNDNETANYTASGTSMASPQVCGAATLIRTAVPALKAEETKAILLATAQDISTKNSSLNRNAYGMGMLRDDSAMTLALNRAGWGRGVVDSTTTTWQRPFTVSTGKTYRAVISWMRQVMTSRNWSDLNVEILQGSTVIASSKTTRNLYEVVIFKATFTGTALMRVTGNFIENNKQEFGWAFTEGSGPPIQSEYTAFGTGCAGASQGCSLGFSTNWTKTVGAKTSNATEICFMEFGHPVLNVCRVDFWMSAKSSPTTINVKIREYDNTKGEPGKVLAATTLNVSTTPGLHTVTISPTVRIAENELFFISIDNISKLNLPVSTTGSDSYHYQLVGTNWSFAADTKWQYQVWSDKGQRVPVLSNTGTPAVGGSFSVDLANARSNTAAVFVLGLSDSKWGAFNLPLMFMPGCNLLASGDVLTGLATSGTGTASVTIPIPNNKALAGALFFNQFLVVDPANAIGIIATNGGRAKIGDV